MNVTLGARQGRPDRTSAGLHRRFWRLLATMLAALVFSPALVACQTPTCTGNLNEYNGKCLTNMAIVFMECTKGRGYDLETEIGGKLGGTFKVVADASVEAAYKSTQKENVVVSLEIVAACLKIAEGAAETPADRSAAAESRETALYIAKLVKSTAHIKIDPTRARVGETIDVTGRNYYPNESVAIVLHATLIKQVQADSQGAFATTFTVPKNALPVGFPSTISASGETSVKSARAPFEVIA